MKSFKKLFMVLSVLTALAGFTIDGVDASETVSRSIACPMEPSITDAIKKSDPFTQGACMARALLPLDQSQIFEKFTEFCSITKNEVDFFLKEYISDLAAQAWRQAQLLKETTLPLESFSNEELEMYKKGITTAKKELEGLLSQILQYIEKETDDSYRLNSLARFWEDTLYAQRFAAKRFKIDLKESPIDLLGAMEKNEKLVDELIEVAPNLVEMAKNINETMDQQFSM